MAGKIFDYIQRRKKEKLHKQWVESGDLTLEDIPQDISLPSEDVKPVEVSRIKVQDISGRLVLVPTRYIWVVAAIIATLLIALAVVVTVLVMRPS